jgi:hypothetical protein
MTGVNCFVAFAPRNDGAFNVSLAEYPECAPNAARSRRNCTTNARACPMAAASQPIVQAATPSPAGLAAGQNHRRSLGRRFRACSRRSPRRTCTRKSRCALPWNLAADPCRNIRSSAGVAAPWSSRQVEARRMIAKQTREANDESPSISAIPASAIPVKPTHDRHPWPHGSRGAALPRSSP